jgi:hypothetical protein
MLSDADRRVLADMESTLRRNDARFVARFDDRRIRKRRRRLNAATCLAVLLVAVGGFATGAAAVALTWLCAAGCAATVVVLWRAMKRRAIQHQGRRSR